jgi:hypothetical protein
MKKIIYIALMIFICLSAKAQQDSIIKSQKFYSEKNYTAALSTINSVIKKHNTAELGNAYQLQAFILKDYAKTLNNEGSYQYRTEALKAIQNAITADNKIDVKSIAKYLSQTFNNDAAQSLGANKFELAVIQFDNYKSAALFYANPVEMKMRDIDFKNAYASALNNQYVSFKIKNESDFKKVEAAYNQVLKDDPQNISANYSLGVLYYNQAIEIVSSVNPDETDIVVIDEMQNKMQPLFKQSKPYLEKASTLAPDRTDVLKGLEIVYFNLNDLAKYKAVQAKLKKLGVK